MMGDPKYKTVDGMIEALQVLANYMSKKLAETYFLEAEHDVICSSASVADCPEDSKDGQRLRALGWHVDSEYDEGYWAYFT